MYLTGLIKRRRLLNIAMRWLKDDPRPGDAQAVSEIFIYEGLLSVASANRFMDQIYGEVFQRPIDWRQIEYKHQLREMALQAIGDPTPRQYEMMEAYHGNPEAFFRRMPTDASLVFSADDRLIGANRLKRPRRVAEKASRRMAEFLVGEIRERATDLAQIRASRQGVPLEQLGPDLEQEAKEFIDAEASVARAFREGTVRIPADALHIDDLIGYKIIGTQEELDRAELCIANHPGAFVAEREPHRGNYKAINILVDLELPSAEELIRRSGQVDWSIARARGLVPEQVAEGFADYIRTGASAFRIELVLTTFDEFLESELGRCIHEYRILEQRTNREYRGQMAKNAELIIEYLLAVAFSPTKEIQEIPVKMWGKYLPETLSYAIRGLYGAKQQGLFFSAGDEK